MEESTPSAKEAVPQECSICLQALAGPISTNCHHVFCEACVCRNISATSPLCPLCRARLTTITSLGLEPKDAKEGAEHEKQQTNEPFVSFVFNSVRYKLLLHKKLSVRAMLAQLLDIPAGRLKFVHKGRLVVDDKELPKICQSKEGTLFVVGSKPAAGDPNGGVSNKVGGFFSSVGQKISGAASVAGLFLSSLVKPHGAQPDGVAPNNNSSSSNNNNNSDNNSNNSSNGNNRRPGAGGRGGFGPRTMTYNYGGCMPRGGG